jgi:hypothetical protein
VRLTLRPAPWFDVDLLPELVHAQGEPRFISGEAPGRLLFGRLDATQVGGTLRATVAFSPDLTLQTSAQLFVAAGRYSDFASYDRTPGTRPTIALADLTPADAPAERPDFQRAGVNASVVLRWEYRLGSVLYVVYTRAQAPSIHLGPDERSAPHLGALPRAPAADVLLLKLTWWWG